MTACDGEAQRPFLHIRIAGCVRVHVVELDLLLPEHRDEVHALHNDRDIERNAAPLHHKQPPHLQPQLRPIPRRRIRRLPVRPVRGFGRALRHAHPPPLGAPAAQVDEETVAGVDDLQDEGDGREGEEPAPEDGEGFGLVEQAGLAGAVGVAGDDGDGGEEGGWDGGAGDDGADHEEFAWFAVPADADV